MKSQHGNDDSFQANIIALRTLTSLTSERLFGFSWSIMNAGFHYIYWLKISGNPHKRSTILSICLFNCFCSSIINFFISGSIWKMWSTCSISVFKNYNSLNSSRLSTIVFRCVARSHMMIFFTKLIEEHVIMVIFFHEKMYLNQCIEKNFQIYNI